jgi:uncharacterized protein (TIGR02145 family)
MEKKNKILFYPMFIIVAFLMLTISCKKEDDKIPTTVIDIDGNIYHTVLIGSQVWMVENLKTTHYRNGDSIPNIKDRWEWSSTKGAYCNYNNDTTNATTYGRLYNWYAMIDNRYIAPTGWHIPTEAEWQTLIAYLGGRSIAGFKMMETGNDLWNSSGFTALPGGRFSQMSAGVYYFIEMNSCGSWGSTTENDSYSSLAIGVYICSSGYNAEIEDFFKKDGLSVRCIKD